MSLRGLAPRRVNLPFVGGLQQKYDPRALPPPGLTIAKDVQFDELGGIQTRYPYASIGSDILGGGTLSDARRMFVYGSELLCFTKTGLYSWDAAVSKWVLKGTHLAVKVDEKPVFVASGDQITADRAELNGTIVYAWCDGEAAWVAAVDKTTGAVLMAPRWFAASTSRPRVVALSTKIMLFFYDGVNGLYCYALDPASPATALAGSSTTVTNTDYNIFYDVCRIGTTDVAAFASRLDPTTSYTVGKVTAGLTVTTSTKARDCAGSIAIAATADGASLCVARDSDGSALLADIITVSSLADVHTDEAIGAGGLKHIAAAFRSVQNSGEYRCYIFWSPEPSGVGVNATEYNWLDTGGTVGSETTLVRGLCIASRAFDYNGEVFLWLVFATPASFSGVSASFGGAVQNTYFLFRDDASCHSTATRNRSGGYPGAQGHLPGVQLTSGTTGFSWCGTERRIVPLGTTKEKGYSDRGPRDITFTFDSNDARRCVKLGETLYIAAGEMLQYDGVRLVELGFHVMPFYFGLIEVAAGNLADGVYAWKVSWAYTNAKGELERSSSAVAGTVTIAGGPNGASIVSWTPLYLTKKIRLSTSVTYSGAPAVEVWRTPVNPPKDSPLYLVTSKDPASGTNPNRYIHNDPALSTLPTFNDEFADTTLTAKEQFPENGARLENVPPPPASIIVASDTRLFLAGVAGDPDRVWYSHLRNDGEVAKFHEGLTVNIPAPGGRMTALAFLGETLMVFRETAIYAITGDGLDNLARGQNYEVRIVPSDVGALHQEAVVSTPLGIVFKSRKGWQLLTQGGQLEYIGGPVSDYDSDTVVAVHVLESKHQIRCLTSSRMLVLDYAARSESSPFGQWSEWSISDGLHAASWNGTYHYLAAAGPKAEQTTYTGLTYGIDVETAWIPTADIQGFGRVWSILTLGEYRSAHRLRVRLARNYQTTYFQDKAWTVSPTTVGEPEQVKHGPSIQEMEAIKIRLTAIDTGSSDPYTAPTGEALKLTHLALDVGVEPWAMRLPAVQQQ